MKPYEEVINSVHDEIIGISRKIGEAFGASKESRAELELAFEHAKIELMDYIFTLPDDPVQYTGKFQSSLAKVWFEAYTAGFVYGATEYAAQKSDFEDELRKMFKDFGVNQN